LKNPDLALWLDNLAWSYYERERFQEAESAVRRALALRREIFGEDHNDTAFSCITLAQV
jgi:hypothetical protein